MHSYHLKDFLRTPESCIFNFRASPMKEGISMKTLYVSKQEYEQNLSLKSLEKDLNRRLYYQSKQKGKNISEDLNKYIY